MNFFEKLKTMTIRLKVKNSAIEPLCAVNIVQIYIFMDQFFISFDQIFIKYLFEETKNGTITLISRKKTVLLVYCFYLCLSLRVKACFETKFFRELVYPCENDVVL